MQSDAPPPSSNYPTEVQQLLVGCAADAALAVRAAVAALPVEKRVLKAPTPLKPPPAVAALPDLHGEQAAFECLQALANACSCEVRVVVDPSSGQCYSLYPMPSTPCPPHTSPPSPSATPAPSTTPINPSSAHTSAPLPSATSTSTTLPTHPPLPAPSNSTSTEQPGTRYGTSQCIYVYLDAVDGTVKLSGLGNAPGCARVVNDGAWAVGLAFTEPTRAALDQLTISDFSVACIVDGTAPLACPPRNSSNADARDAHGDVSEPNSNSNNCSFPAAAVAFRTSQVPIAYQTHAMVFPYARDEAHVGGNVNHMATGRAVIGPRLYASTCTTLNQVFAYLDAFQAFDRATQGPQDEQLACSLYAALISRHAGGAFDVLRSYGNLSGLLRTMLGWGPCSIDTSTSGEQPSYLTLEPQCGVFAVVNENLANLLPCVPIVLGAQCEATTLEGEPLAGRRLSQGRTSVLYAANPSLHMSVLKLVAGISLKQK